LVLYWAVPEGARQWKANSYDFESASGADEKKSHRTGVIRALKESSGSVPEGADLYRVGAYRSNSPDASWKHWQEDTRNTVCKEFVKGSIFSRVFFNEPFLLVPSVFRNSELILKV
jgi:hypothetical protein